MDLDPPTMVDYPSNAFLVSDETRSLMKVWGSFQLLILPISKISEILIFVSLNPRENYKMILIMHFKLRFDPVLK